MAEIFTEMFMCSNDEEVCDTPLPCKKCHKSVRYVRADVAMRYARMRERAMVDLIKSKIILDKRTCSGTYNHDRMLLKGFNRSLLMCEEAQQQREGK